MKSVYNEKMINEVKNKKTLGIFLVVLISIICLIIFIISMLKVNDQNLKKLQILNGIIFALSAIFIFYFCDVFIYINSKVNKHIKYVSKQEIKEINGTVIAINNNIIHDKYIECCEISIQEDNITENFLLFSDSNPFSVGDSVKLAISGIYIESYEIKENI